MGKALHRLQQAKPTTPHPLFIPYLSDRLVFRCRAQFDVIEVRIVSEELTRNILEDP